MASAKCSGVSSVDLSKSAMVLATFKILSYARAESCKRVMAVLSSCCASGVILQTALVILVDICAFTFPSGSFAEDLEDFSIIFYF